MPQRLTEDKQNVIANLLRDPKISRGQIATATGVSTRAVSRIATNIRKHGTTRPGPTGFKIGRPTSMSKDMAQALIQWVEGRECKFLVKDAVDYLAQNFGYKGCEGTVGRVLTRAGYQRRESGRGKRNEITEWARPPAGIDWEDILTGLNANEERRYVVKKKRKATDQPGSNQAAGGPGDDADLTGNSALPQKVPKVRAPPAPKQYKRGPYKTDPNKVERRGRPRYVPQPDMIINGQDIPDMPSALDPRLTGTHAANGSMRLPDFINSNNLPPHIRAEQDLLLHQSPQAAEQIVAAKQHDLSSSHAAAMSPDMSSLHSSIARLQSLENAAELTQEEVLAAVLPNLDVEALQSQVASQQQLIAQLQKQLARHGKQPTDQPDDHAFEA